MTFAGSQDHSARAEEEALAWVARLKAPDGAGDQEAFERWYASDTHHAEAFDRVIASWERSGRLRETSLARERRPFFGLARSDRRRRFAIGAVAAAAILALVTVGGWPSGIGRDPLMSAAYASEIGEIRTVRLADGSRVTLDTNTSVQANFTLQERHVRLLRGRARFRVTSDPRPFIVDAGSLTLTGRGTSFDVDTTGGAITVASFDGGPELASAPAPSKDEARTVSVGQTLSFTPDTPLGRLANVNASEARWTTGMLSFNDASLAEVVDRANLYAETKIILADEAVKHLRFTGTFRPTDTQSLARMLAAMFKLRLRHDQGPNLTLSSEGSGQTRK